MWDWIIIILVGAVCGWLSGMLMGSKSKGILVYIILGVVGGEVGNIVFGLLASNMLVFRIIRGVIGTCILIAIGRAVLKKK